MSSLNTFLNRRNGKSFEWSQIRSVWYRRPSMPAEIANGLSEQHRKFVSSETYQLLQHQLLSLDQEKVTWVSHPSAIHRANSRFLQFRAAKKFGFPVPRTIITNEPKVVATFADTSDSEFFAMKRISSHSQLEGEVSFFTERITRSRLLELCGSFVLCPTLVQEYIPKACEYRVTVIGNKAFVCKLHSQDNPNASVDWRQTSPDFVPHEIVEAPVIAAKAIALVQYLGLLYGAIDLIEKPDGEIVFLEVNPNGQWLRIEEITGARMSEAMADLLMINREGKRRQATV